MKGTPEPDAGTGRTGPLGDPIRRAPAANPAGDGVAVPGRPWLRRDPETGRLRTHDYQPTTPLPRD
jgi:hypothetical protein